MNTSARGVSFLASREGRRLHAYRDSKGIPTIGIGMTTFNGKPVEMGLSITSDQCDREFSKQLVGYVASVNAAIKVPVTQNQFDALVSLCWNIGQGAFQHSSVVKRINARDYKGAANAFMLWIKPPELIGRRRAEVTQFETPDSETVAAAKTPSMVAVDAVKGAPVGATKTSSTANSFWSVLMDAIKKAVNA